MPKHINTFMLHGHLLSRDTIVAPAHDSQTIEVWTG
jgi:hypothetical protein